MSVNSKMTALADEIRELSGTTAKIGLDGMTTHVANANTEIDDQAALLEQAIAALEGKAAGGAPAPVLQEKSVSPTTTSQTVKPDSGYDALSKVTVAAMPTATQATPSITVSSAGKITATSTQTAGYVAAGTKTATKQLTTQAAQTITPGTSNKTIASGTYLTGIQTIKGDANLKAENIAEGVSIFGVVGTHSGSTSEDGGGAEHPEAPDSGGSSSFEVVDVTVHTQKNPMVATKYVSKIVSSANTADGLIISNQTSGFVYLNIVSAVVGTLIFIKTANNPSSCTVRGDLELIDFVSSSHAIVRVAADGEIDDNSIDRAIRFS